MITTPAPIPTRNFLACYIGTLLEVSVGDVHSGASSFCILERDGLSEVWHQPFLAGTILF